MVVNLIVKNHLGQRCIRKKEKEKHKKSEDIVSSPTHVVINIKENLPERGERKTKENVDKR